MAKFISHIFNQASGSIGGITMQNGPGAGILIRSKPIPCHRMTEKQLITRVSFGASSSKTKRLSNEEISLWNDLSKAKNYSQNEDFYLPSGLQFHTRNDFFNSYLRSRSIFSTPFESPPSFADDLPLEYGEIGNPLSGQTGFSIRLINKSDILVRLMFWLSVPFRPTRKSVPSYFRWQRFETRQANPGQQRIQYFHDLISGKVYFLKVRSFSAVSERNISASQFHRILVS